MKAGRRLASLALLAAAAASGAASGMLLAFSAMGSQALPALTGSGSLASNHGLLLSQTLGAGLIGLAAVRRPGPLPAVALPLGLMALILTGAGLIPSARLILLVGGFIGGCALGAVLVVVLNLSGSTQPRDRRAAAAGAAWVVALFIVALAATFLPTRPGPALSAMAASILSTFGASLAWTARPPPNNDGAQAIPVVGAVPPARGPDALIFLFGAASATTVMGLGAWSAEAGMARVLFATACVAVLAGAGAATILRGRAALVITASFGAPAIGFVLLQGALTLPFALAAAALLGAGLGGLPVALLAWRSQIAFAPPAAFAVAALFFGQAAGVVTWMALLASPLPHGTAFVLLTTLLGLAAFASPGLVAGQKPAPSP